MLLYQIPIYCVALVAGGLVSHIHSCDETEYLRYVVSLVACHDDLSLLQYPGLLTTKPLVLDQSTYKSEGNGAFRLY